ncbi:hypothetical protein GCWU000324_02136 [Kingella oralis ATCC 51147]|uniref:Uncharacterized protein n=1 Tax=Kingella oralis ATCC 51147 TaxID=629741 RepID=C4GJB4_9NEIS|nr:hypothetical protein GCWU000324_02136 [Kingella oralis ATCC 51147]
MGALLGVGVGVGLGVGWGVGCGVGLGAGCSGVGVGWGCSGVGAILVLPPLFWLPLPPEWSGAGWFGVGAGSAESLFLCLPTMMADWLEPERPDESVATRWDFLQPETAMAHTSMAISVLFIMFSCL